MKNSTLMEADLTALSHEQLVAMVAVRGEALMAFIEADNGILRRIKSGTLRAVDMRKADEAKRAALIKLGEEETAILFGRAGGPAVN